MSLFQLTTGELFYVTCWYGEPTPVYYDLNGFEKPNRFGFDVFLFTLDDQKGIIPTPHGDCSENSKN